MREINVKSIRAIQVFDITDLVRDCLPQGANGLYHVFCPHTTASILIGENEDALMRDYEKVAATLLSHCRPFEHCGHGVPNGEAHIFGALHGCSALVPVMDGTIKLGTFQRILFFELDGPRERKVWVSPVA